MKIACPYLLIPSSFEESEDGLDCSGTSYNLMEKRSVEKSILLELEREHHLKIQVCVLGILLCCSFLDKLFLFFAHDV